MSSNVDIQTFLALLNDRLHRGASEYGDRSFTRPVPQTVREVEEELLDVAGWAFVMWVQTRARLGACAKVIEEAEVDDGE